MVQTQGMTMTSPTVLRRIAAAELVRHREAAGIDQVDVDQACEMSRGSTSRYETCYSSMSASTARRVFSFLGVSGGELEALVEIAKGSRKRTSEAVSVKGLPNWFQSYAILERAASQITELSLSVIPGLLQTREYARAVLQVGQHGSQLEEHLETRMARKALLEGENPLKFWAIIHESVFSRAVGGPKVMSAQIDHLISIADTENVTIQVIPNSIGAHPAMGTSFIQMRFAIAPQFGVIYVEHHGGTYYYDHPAEVERYDLAHRQLMKTALNDDKSIQLMQRVKDSLYP
ncbi:helix-turn-helix transcriptional regulator [Glycomyces sp. YM15]|uniref:helix-turn-helix domain-containing protein n=1 Tax=Glycomyces sp. YM15 TaxID=2800446 RepID=UPI0019640D0D|nr:helix-turn-helix transcriptional regulator [Glycomyces sp. YM15]